MAGRAPKLNTLRVATNIRRPSAKPKSAPKGILGEALSLLRHDRRVRMAALGIIASGATFGLIDDCTSAQPAPEVQALSANIHNAVTTAIPPIPAEKSASFEKESLTWKTPDTRFSDMIDGRDHFVYPEGKIKDLINAIPADWAIVNATAEDSGDALVSVFGCCENVGPHQNLVYTGGRNFSLKLGESAVRVLDENQVVVIITADNRVIMFGPPTLKNDGWIGYQMIDDRKGKYVLSSKSQVRPGTLALTEENWVSRYNKKLSPEAQNEILYPIYAKGVESIMQGQALWIKQSDLQKLGNIKFQIVEEKDVRQTTPENEGRDYKLVKVKLTEVNN